MPSDINTNEHAFWLQLLGDHMRFVQRSLSYSESEYALQAGHYVTLFDTLYAQSVDYLPEIAQKRFWDTAYNAAQQERTFLLSLLRRMLQGDLCINLAPGFLNQMANEAEEYLRILDHIKKNTDSRMHPIHYHLLFLLNCSISADGININIDPLERSLLRVCHRHARKFDNLYLKSIEHMGFLRTGLPDYAGLRRLNKNVLDELASFASFLLELEDSLKSREILGTLCRLYVNHIYRKACYYACRLSDVSDLGETSFDLSQKRRD